MPSSSELLAPEPLSSDVEELSLRSHGVLEVVPRMLDHEPAEAGSVIGRYRLLHELGRGAMARVHVAVTHGPAGFEHLAAIKTLLDCYAQSEDLATMLLDEARVGAAIRHPNVVETLAVGIDPRSGPFLVMQYVEGVTLAALAKRAKETSTPLPTRVVVRVLADMLEGLAAAHAVRGPDGEPMRIVHRDVSPQNLIVGVDGVAKVADFGVAKAKARLTTTRAGQFKGKASYSSPEHISGARIDARADVFSAGVMLWEGLVGARLFKGDMVASMRRVLHEPIPWVSRLAPQHDAFDEVVARALERDRDRRFQSADALLEALIGAAEASCGMGTHREVAACVESLCGDTIASERRVIAHQRTMARPSRAKTELPSAPEDLSSLSSSSIDITIPSPPPVSLEQDAREARARRTEARHETVKVRVERRRRPSKARLFGMIAVVLGALAVVAVTGRAIRTALGSGGSEVVAAAVPSPEPEAVAVTVTEPVTEAAAETTESETVAEDTTSTTEAASAAVEAQVVRPAPRRARPVVAPPARRTSTAVEATEDDPEGTSRTPAASAEVPAVRLASDDTTRESDTWVAAAPSSP